MCTQSSTSSPQITHRLPHVSTLTSSWPTISYSVYRTLANRMLSRSPTPSSGTTNNRTCVSWLALCYLSSLQIHLSQVECPNNSNSNSLNNINLIRINSLNGVNSKASRTSSRTSKHGVANHNSRWIKALTNLTNQTNQVNLTLISSHSNRCNLIKLRNIKQIPKMWFRI